jgi:branched-chain amino acid transport system permease protein
MLMLGWALAAAMGAIAAMLVAPIVVLTPNMMFSVLVLALAAAVLGGLDSPVGAVVGGFLVGVIQNLVGAYLNDVLGLLPLSLQVAEPNQYREVVGTAIIILALTLRPHGLFGRGEVRRV